MPPVCPPNRYCCPPMKLGNMRANGVRWLTVSFGPKIQAQCLLEATGIRVAIRIALQRWAGGSVHARLPGGSVHTRLLR